MTKERIMTNVASFNTLEEKYVNITTSYDDLLNDITKHISFSSTNLEESKNTLKEYVISYNKLCNEKSIKERTLSTISKLPIIGTSAIKLVDDMRKERLEGISVSQVVTELYDGLNNKSLKLESTLKSLMEVSNKAETLCDVLGEVDNELDTLIERLEKNDPDYVSAMRLSSQVKILIKSSADKIDSLAMIIQVGTGLLTKMIKVLPVNKTELLSNLAMDSGVSQINDISKDVSEITKLTRGISDSIYDKTHTAVLELIRMNSVSQDDVKHLRTNAEKRIALTNEVNDAVRKMHENLITDRNEVIKAVSDSSKTSKSLGVSNEK